MRREDGAAAVEFAILGSLLLLLATGFLPILQAVSAYNDLSRATAEGLRYATHAAPNPVTNPGCATPGSPQGWTRWPSADEVRDYVQASASRQDAEVLVVGVDGQNVSPCTMSFAADRTIVVIATVDQDLGPLAAAANAMAGFFGGDGPFPDETITLTARSEGLKE